MGSKYFLLWCDDDQVMSKVVGIDELREWLNGEGKGYKALPGLPEDLSVFPAKSAFILKGETVMPKPIVTWDIA